MSRKTKSKYDEAVVTILQCLEKGYSNQRAAEAAGIIRDTFYRWLKEKQGFSDAVKNARETFLLNAANEVERSLYEKATGYKIKKRRTEYMSGADGKPFIAKIIETEEEVVPDTVACIFLLTNLRPEKWKNRQNIEGTQNITVSNFKGFDAALPPTRSDEELDKLTGEVRKAFMEEHNK